MSIIVEPIAWPTLSPNLQTDFVQFGVLPQFTKQLFIFWLEENTYAYNANQYTLHVFKVKTPLAQHKEELVLSIKLPAYVKELFLISPVQNGFYLTCSQYDNNFVWFLNVTTKSMVQWLNV